MQLKGPKPNTDTSKTRVTAWVTPLPGVPGLRGMPGSKGEAGPRGKQESPRFYSNKDTKGERGTLVFLKD